MGSHGTQSLLLPDFPGPCLSPFGVLRTCLWGHPHLPPFSVDRTGWRGHHTQLPLLFQPLLPAAVAP